MPKTTWNFIEASDMDTLVFTIEADTQQEAFDAFDEWATEAGYEGGWIEWDWGAGMPQPATVTVLVA